MSKSSSRCKPVNQRWVMCNSVNGKSASCFVLSGVCLIALIVGTYVFVFNKRWIRCKQYLHYHHHLAYYLSGKHGMTCFTVKKV